MANDSNKTFWDLWIPFAVTVVIVHLTIAVRGLMDMADYLQRIADQLTK